jgi:hypothetical protein
MAKRDNVTTQLTGRTTMAPKETGRGGARAERSGGGRRARQETS